MTTTLLPMNSRVKRRIPASPQAVGRIAALARVVAPLHHWARVL